MLRSGSPLINILIYIKIITMLKIIIFIIIAVLIIGIGVWYNRRLDNENQFSATKETPGLKIDDLIIGTGAEAKNGDVLSVNYVGTLENGQEFDNSYKRGQPFEFKLGAGQVIRGFDLGFLGTKVGGKRNIIIPPEFGYGSQSLPGIPPNSTLKFTVELLAIHQVK